MTFAKNISQVVANYSAFFVQLSRFMIPVCRIGSNVLK